MIRRRLHHIARTSAILVVVIGVLVMFGWLAGVGLLLTVLPGLTVMKMNAAIGFTLAGGSLLLQIAPGVARRAALAGRAAAWLVTALGAATLTEYVSGVDLGIDQLIVHDPTDPAVAAAGRMAVLT